MTFLAFLIGFLCGATGMFLVACWSERRMAAEIERAMTSVKTQTGAIHEPEAEQ